MPFGVVGIFMGYSYYKYFWKSKELGSYKTTLQSGVGSDGKAQNIGPVGSIWSLFISVRTGISIQHLNFVFIRMLSRVVAPVARVPVRFARHVSSFFTFLFFLIVYLGYYQVWFLDRFRYSSCRHLVRLWRIRWYFQPSQGQC